MVTSCLQIGRSPWRTVLIGHQWPNVPGCGGGDLAIPRDMFALSFTPLPGALVFNSARATKNPATAGFF
jgi:hypothetical protein